MFMTTIGAVAIAQPLEAFFTERLLRDRQASPHTIAAYPDSFRLLLSFAQHTLGKLPSALTLGDLDAPFICRFLQSLERTRRNSARTRNLRLAAIHSFFRYLATQEPACSALIQRVLAGRGVGAGAPPLGCNHSLRA
jgi:site-specific recombinase XerC